MRDFLQPAFPLSTAIAETQLCNATAKRYGSRLAWMLCLLLSGSAGMFSAATAFLPSSFSMMLLCAASAAALQGRLQARPRRSAALPPRLAAPEADMCVLRSVLLRSALSAASWAGRLQAWLASPLACRRALCCAAPTSPRRSRVPGPAHPSPPALNPAKLHGRRSG